MIKTVTTDAGAFAVYEAYLRAAESGSEPLLDLSDASLYGSSGQEMTAAEMQQESVDISATLIAGERGAGAANPLSFQAVSQIADSLLAQVEAAKGLAAQPDSDFTPAELEARAAQLSADMIAQFEARIAADPLAASYLPSTDLQRQQFNQGVLEAMNAMSDARSFVKKLADGDASPENIGLAVTTSVKAATSFLGALPLPPQAKAAVSVINIATYLGPAIVAVAKGDGSPEQIGVAALQAVVSIASWGLSDYLFDYILPYFLEDPQRIATLEQMLLHSPQDVLTHYTGVIIEELGGTVPIGFENKDNTEEQQALERAYLIAADLNSAYRSILDDLKAQYGNSNFYQEISMQVNPAWQAQTYRFVSTGSSFFTDSFRASGSPFTTDPWQYLSLNFTPSWVTDASNSGSIFNQGGVFILLDGTSVTQTSAYADSVVGPASLNLSLLAGDDSYSFSQDAQGGTGVSPYYQTVTAGSINGGDGWDTLSTVGLTRGNPAGYTGDIVVDHNTVRYVIGEFYGLDPANYRTIATHQNFEEFHLGSLRLFDMRQSANSVKLVTEGSTDSISETTIYGSSYSDTLIIDTSRLTTTYVDYFGGIINYIRYGDFSTQRISVDAGAGQDYVAGELVNGAHYAGGAGIDTFEIYAPDAAVQGTFQVDIAGSYIVTSLDLESGETWMRTHVTGGNQFGGTYYDIVVHTDTTATVTGFEWAVGSQYHDTIYALNAGSRLRGQEGNDRLVGRDGRDQLYGGNGNDVLTGGGGADRLQGGAGNDTLDGGAGRDVIMGGSGHDVITDLQGANLISGGSGNDRIQVGDAGNEILAGADNDVVTAGSGNDTISLGHGLDEVNAGAGDDVVTDVWAAGNIQWNNGIEWVSRNAVLDGGAGYDVLSVDVSGSSLIYEDSATFRSDSFSYYFVTGIQDFWRNEYVIDNPATGEGHWAPVYRYHEYLNFEEIHLTGGDITVDLVDWPDFEPDFWPSISGHTIDNAIGTGSGHDNVALGAGNDTYYAGLGNDTIAGESDYDTIDYSRLDAGYTVDFSGLDANGNGTIRILNGDGTLAATDTVSGFEAITGTRHGEAISLDAGDNELRGGGGNDTLRGGAGNDRFLFGSNDGADILADAAIGDVLVFEGPDGSTAPVLARSGSAGNYTYTVTFGSTTATFTSPDLLDLNASSASAGGITTWEMTVADGTLVARDDSGAAFNTDEDTVLTTGDVLANDTDPGLANMQIVSYDAVSANGAAVTRVPGTGQFTYDPANIFDGLIDGQSATDTFTYTVSDGTTTTTVTVTINVAGFTDNPVAYADSAVTTEDAPVTIDALANDLDPGAQDAVVSQFDSTSSGGGTVAYNGDGTFTYTPGADFNSLGAGETGTDTFTYTLDDGRYASTTTVTVTVTGVDDPFTVQDDSRVVLEDQVLTLDVLANDIDPDGDPVSLVSVGTPNAGTAEIVNGQIVYTPPLNYNGPVSFTYEATDGVSTRTATVSLNYVPVDDAPTAVNDSFTVTAGDWVYLDVLANDSDPEGGNLSIFTAYTPLTDIGQVAVVNNMIAYYVPVGTTGTEDIAYGIFDDAGHQAGATATVTIIGEVAPTAVPYVYNATEDTPYTMQAISGFSDRNGDSLSVVSIQTENIANATVVDNGDGTFTVTPDANFTGTVYVPVVVTDGLHETAHTQIIEFRNTYDPVTLADDVYRINPDELLVVHTADLLANDTNPDGPMTGYVTSIGLGVNGTVSGYSGESQTSNFVNPGHPGLMNGPSAVLLETSGGRVTFTPDAGFHGVATFQYNFFETTVHAYTPGNGQVTVMVDTDVAAADDTATTAEDTAVIIDVLANDSDADGDAMVVHRVDQPANGSAEVLADGAIRYTPDANFNGTETITYYVGSQYQPENAASIATITVSVTPVADPIAAVDDSVTTAEDQQVVLDLTANDLNPDGQSGAVLSVGTPAHGSIVQNGQTFTYVPDANFNGTDSFSYTREDGLGGTTTATVTVNVTGVNDAPAANGDSVTVAEDGSLTFDPRSNDSDPESSALSVTALGTPAHGSAQVNADGTVTYVPDANYFGSDSFTYTVSDGDLTATATITVAVQPVQDVPVAVNDSATTAEDTSVVINVIANDTELDGEGLSVTAVTGAANGQVQFSGGRITFTPDADFNGAEQLTYTVSDGNGGTATATVDITVTPVNDAPVVVNDSSSAVQGATQTLNPLANDSDADGPQLSITALNGTAVQPGQFVSLASGALVFLNGDGTVSLFPGGNYDHLTLDQNVTETVSYTVSDGAGGTASGTIAFTVTGINDAPAAVPDRAATQEDTAVTVGVLVNDRDAEGNPLSLTGVADPANGTVSFTAGGSITYTPGANFNGVEVITYTVADGHGGSSTGTLTVSVAAVNDLPVAADDAVTTSEDTAVTIDVLANDSDTETADLLITAATQGSNGTVTAVNGQLVYTPDADFNGTDTFTYTVSDRQGGTAEAAVTVTVQPVNDAPAVAGDTAATSEDSAVTLAPLANDSDPEGAALAITALDGTPVTAGGSVTLAGGAIVTLNADGTVTFDPNGAYDALQAGDSPAVVQIPYSVADPDGLTSSGVFEVTVNGVNDPAAFSGQLSAAMSEDDAGASGRITVTDPDSPQQMAPGSYTGSYGNLNLAADGSWTYTRTAVLDYLEPGQNVTDSFALASADGTPAALVVTIEGALDHLVVTGTAAGEALDGGSGNDTITGLGGDDTISGGAGTDQAVYLGNSSDFTFAFGSGRNSVIITDNNSQDGLDEGADSLLAGTDTFIFADGASGRITWSGGEATSIEVRRGGQIVDRLTENASGVQTQGVYENVVLISDVSTDGGGQQSVEPWATRERFYDDSGQIAREEFVFDDGATRSAENTYVNGIRTARTITDGAGAQSSATWSTLTRSFDTDGNIIRDDFVFDDGSTRSAENTYVNGIRTARTITDGAGAQSSANWTVLQLSYAADGSLSENVADWDNGDRSTFLFEAGVLTTRIREDLNDDQPFQTATTTYAPDGSVIGTSYVWDVIG
ncbi:Ig-like domain-containing protein [Leisingera sp. SS27]|uniref:Ig-like domain-containing protein n=1 Tax=Leisingera sp. SS27 TaxID=2979462 RepID=UPI00232E8AFD|nr:Ig-like domain-containing protein [Leisingera sp. SS27]MDC0657513.1 Ig-like domain-containing protein [Leisingera sp. SS27]